jgi:hypothetical protein
MAMSDSESHWDGDGGAKLTEGGSSSLETLWSVRYGTWRAVVEDGH